MNDNSSNAQGSEIKQPNKPETPVKVFGQPDKFGSNPKVSPDETYRTKSKDSDSSKKMDGSDSSDHKNSDLESQPDATKPAKKV